MADNSFRASFKKLPKLPAKDAKLVTKKDPAYKEPTKGEKRAKRLNRRGY